MTPALKNASSGADSLARMTLWAWIAVGAAAALGVSLLVGLAIAAVLGTIGREVGELVETESWSSAPPARAGASPATA
jgi:hypothetical protein